MYRILFLASGYSIHTVRWVNAIVDRGFETHLLSLHPVRGGLDSRVHMHRVPFPPNWGYFANCPWVRAIVERIKPHLIHAHYASGYGTVAALAGFHPTLLSVWGSDVYDFPQQSRLRTKLLEFNLARADKILSTSHVMAKETSKYTDKPIDVTPFGVDLERFRPQRLQSMFDPEDIVVGTVKALHENYGIEYLIRAFRLLKDRHPGLPLKLLIVGEGPQEADLKMLSKDLGLSKDTLFAGHVLHTDVPEYLNVFSVFVAVSILDRESFGVAVIEASACGKPVVVSDTGGLPEVVEDSVTGFLVPPSSPHETADAIEKLVLNESLRVRMGKAGRERIRRLYDWDANVDHMVNIYRSVLDG